MLPHLAIADVDRSDWLETGSLSIQDRLGSRSTLHLTLGGEEIDAYPESYCPDEDDELVITDEDEPPTVQFGGYVLLPARSGLAGMSLVQVDAVDYNVLADDRYVTASVESGQTLKQVVTALADYLPDFITLDPAMPDGPVLSEWSWTNRRLADCWNDLTIATAGEYLIRIGHDAVLRILALGSLDAPFAITDETSHLLGDPEPTVRRLRDQFANRVWQWYGSGQGYAEQDFTTTGGQTVYTTDYRAPNDIHTQWPNQLIVNGVPICPVFWGPDMGPPESWYWDWETHSLINETGTPLNADDVVHTWQTIQYPCLAMAEDTGDQEARGRIIEWVAPDIPDVIPKAQADALAAGYLAQRLAMPREFSAATDEAGLAPGQTISIEHSRLGILAPTDFLITTVVYRHLAGGEGIWSFTAVEGNVYLGSFLDTYRAWGEGGSGAGGGVGGGIVLSATTMLHAHLGGSRTVPIRFADWTTIEDFQTFKAPLTGSYRFRVEAKTTDAGTSVQARLYDVTTGAAVAGSTTTATASTTWVEEEKTVTLLAGHRYITEQIGSNVLAGVLVGQATIEV